MVEFDIDEIDDGREHYPILMQQNADTSNRLVNQLQPGEEAAFPIHIYFNFEKIKEDDFMEMFENNTFMIWENSLGEGISLQKDEE